MKEQNNNFYGQNDGGLLGVYMVQTKGYFKVQV